MTMRYTLGPRDPHPYNPAHHNVRCATCAARHRKMVRRVTEREREIREMRSLMGAPSRY